MPEDLNGTVVDSRYEILSSLGEGGMGVVFLARDLDNERTVAVKVMHELADDEESKRRFYREAKLWSLLRHQGIGRFYQYGEWGKIPYIVMEFLPGTTLEQYLRERGTIEWKEVLAICKPICDSLQYLHDQNVIHRDLKPANIILCDDNQGEPKLIDFGLARSAETALAPSQALTVTGMLVGSYPYMSPEQCAGQRSTAKSDMYAFGCIMFELIAGRQVFEADSPIGVIYKHSNETPPELRKLAPSIPSRLATVVDSLLEKTPNKRPSAAKLKQELESILQNPHEQEKLRLDKRFSDAIIGTICLLSVAAIALGLRNTLQCAAPGANNNSSTDFKRALPGARLESVRQNTPRSIVDHRTSVLKSIKDPSVRSGLNGLRPEIFAQAFHDAHSELMRAHKYQEATELCGACNTIITSMPAARRHQFENYLAIPMAESAMATGNAVEAENAIRKYSKSSTSTSIENVLAEARVSSILAWSLIVQQKYNEAESVVKDALNHASPITPPEVHFKLNWLLAEIYWRKGQSESAKASLPEFRSTPPREMFRKFNAQTGGSDIAHRIHESWSDGYAITGNRQRQIQHLWIAMQAARKDHLLAESERLKAAAVYVLTGKSIPVGFIDPYSLFRALPNWQTTSLKSFKQEDDAYNRLQELCAPNDLLASMQLRKCQLYKRAGNFTAAEASAREALVLSMLEGRSQGTIEAAALIAECLIVRRDLKNAAKFIKLIESDPNYGLHDTAKTIASEYYIARQDTKALEKLLSWSKTTDANKLTIGTSLASQHNLRGNYSAALNAIERVKKVSRWNHNSDAMVYIFRIYADKSDWNNLFKLRDEAGTDVIRHEITAMLANELLIKGRKAQFKELIDELNRTRHIEETPASASQLADLYNRAVMLDDWQRLLDKIGRQVSFDGATYAALGAECASCLDRHGRRSEAERLIKTVLSNPASQQNETVQCFLGDIYERRRDLDALRRVFSSTTENPPEKKRGRATVALQLGRLLVQEHRSDEAISLLTKTVIEMDAITFEPTKSRLSDIRTQVAAVLALLKAPSK
ncbi:MAG: serine/threonine protein kinase [Candidatus Obscuribacterales bacterium]|nr:serine/threonine protein kinase [Candidatus Obscuribacterales bacterium]